MNAGTCVDLPLVTIDSDKYANHRNEIRYLPSGLAAQNENLRLIQRRNYHVTVLSYRKAIALVL